jgi:hypothetical protein
MKKKILRELEFIKRVIREMITIDHVKKNG